VVETPAAAGNAQPEIPVLVTHDAPAFVEPADLRPDLSPENGTRINVVAEVQSMQVEVRNVAASFLSPDKLAVPINDSDVGNSLEQLDRSERVVTANAVVGIERKDVLAARNRNAGVASGGNSLVRLPEDQPTFLFQCSEQFDRSAM